MEFLNIKRALLSVTDKEGLIELASFLHKQNVEIVSTGGTFSTLTSAGISVTNVSTVTGFPEILNGRVKTLHPYIYGGILTNKDNPEHIATLQNFKIQPFDLICVNLYNFQQALDNYLTLPEIIEHIDIGGPCMIRAAAKNFHNVLVLPSIKTYAEAIQEMEKNTMSVSLSFRQKMAAQAFEQTAQYDNTIMTYLKKTIK